MTLQEFEKLVGDALDTLPAEFARKLENVEIVVEIWPSPQQLASARVPAGNTLFGLYQGIPQTKRGTYQAVLPDKISVFAGPIVMTAGEDPRVVQKMVTDTVLHEIGHHFGMSDEEIRAAGK
jgi:predicted Zn-dependent protease with MMP-like domain